MSIRKNNIKNSIQSSKNPINKLMDFIDKPLNKISSYFINNEEKIVPLAIKGFMLITFGYIFNRLGFIYSLTGSIFETFISFPYIKDFPIPSLGMEEIMFMVVGISLLIFILFIKGKTNSQKNMKTGIEYGSAVWGKKEDIKGFMDLENTDNNVILTKTEGIRMNGRPESYVFDRNKNVLVVGGSGSGKTRFFVKPNLMQKHSSYVVTDPKGSVLTECGVMLRTPEVKKDINNKPVLNYKGEEIKEGYKIKVFNTINFDKSMHYNPFAYIKSEFDIISFVNVLIANTKGQGDKAGEDFWVKSERLYLMALVGYIMQILSPEEQNFDTLLMLVNMSEAREDDETYENPVDKIFKGIDQNSLASRMYKKYKQAAGKTAKSILISVSARLAVFDIKEVREITMYDEMELDKLGGYVENTIIKGNELIVGDRIKNIDNKDVDITIKNYKQIKKYLGKQVYIERLNTQKSALFIIIDDTNATLNFLVAIMYSQLFNLLSNKADDEFGGKLPVPVRCLIDEFANIGQIPEFEKLIATIRSRLISASIVLQTKSQLKGIYKDHADTIIGNCDSELFLGGREETTLKSLSEFLGKQTIDVLNTSESFSQQKSHSHSYQKTGRDLMSKDELAVMDGSKCILQLRGVRPFFSEKYDITKHKRYKLLDEYDEERNTFNSEKYIERLKRKKEVESVSYKMVSIDNQIKSGLSYNQTSRHDSHNVYFDDLYMQAS